MTAAWYESDDALLQELGTALRSPIEDRTAMLMSGYDLATADFIETELLFDSLTATAAPVRSSEQILLEPRTMTFGSNGIEIEIDLDDGRLIGHVDPPQACEVFLDQLTGSSAFTPDELGSFEFDAPTARFRIRLQTSSGTTYVTPWIVPNGNLTE